MKVMIRKLFCSSVLLIILIGMIGVQQQVLAASLLLEHSILTEEELELMQDQEVYTVGYSTASIPNSYVADGELMGIGVDVLNEMAEEMGITLEYVDIDTTSLDLDTLDISLRMDNFSTKPMSDTFISFPTVLVTKLEDEGEVATVAVHAQYGLTTIDPMLLDTEFIYYTNFIAAKAAFDAGETDALLMATVGYEKVTTEVDNGTYRLQLLETPINFRFSFREDFPQEKVEVFNKLIADLDESSMSFLVQKHSNYMQWTYGIWDQILDNLDIAAIEFIICFAIFTGILLVWQRRKRKKLEYTMSHDSLTGLLSENKFIEEARKILKQNIDCPYHIVALDIDNFKGINEMYGFEIGTKILQKTAECVCKTLADVEFIMTRNFADNFFLMLKESTITDQLMGEQEEYYYIESELRKIIQDDYKFSFSLGVYTVRNREEEISLMMDWAVTAREKGKSTVGYTINHYTESMRIARMVRNNILATMEDESKEREVVVYYQPKIDLNSDKTTGAEALVRWKQNNKVIAPNNFIPTFEKNGFIGTLDYYVLDAVCRFIRDHGAKEIPLISVNLSGITVMQKNLVESILEVTNRHKVQSCQIELEITESAFVDNFEKAIHSLEILREHGFRIAMDDFGTGVSTLHRLKDIPLDTLKIDRAFITESTNDDKGMAIIENIVRMAKEINLETVAEGIETQKQRDILKKLGCNVGQGYFYAKPLTEAEFAKCLK